MPNLDPIQLHFMARQASDAFISEGINLNTSIAKMAEDQDLGDLHIKRIVEIANHQTNDHLRKEADDKTFAFTLADFPAVEALINTAEPVSDLSKTASAIFDAVTEEKAELSEKLAAFSFTPAEEGAAQLRATKLNLDALSKQAELEIGQIEGQLYTVREEVIADLDKLAQAAKDFLISEGGDIDTLCKVAQVSDPDKSRQWGEIFSHVSKGLKKLGHPFTGPLASASELSAAYRGDNPEHLNGPDVTVINGSSPIQTILRPINQKISIVQSLSNWKNEFDSLASTLREAQQVIVDNDSVHPEMYRYTSELRKIAQEEGTMRPMAALPRKGSSEPTEPFLKRLVDEVKVAGRTPQPLSAQPK
jgi:hypothetical protein